MSELPLGIRNNNPGNIRENGIPWQGRIASAGPFVKFSSPVYGIRALAIILWESEKVHGDNTVSSIISRYAPSNENYTQAYIDFVANKCGVTPLMVIDLGDKILAAKFIAAIIAYENGATPDTWLHAPSWYSATDIQQGMQLARKWG